MSRNLDAIEYLRKKAFRTHSLLSIHFDITYRCPLRCMHCYIDHRDKKELTLKEITKILHDALRLNAIFITYSGGEVFLRRDFEEILSITSKLGFVIKIITSGYLIGEKEADYLKGYNVNQVGVSLYSLRPDIHDRITGIKGSCEKTVKAIDLLLKRGINVVVKTSIMRDNYRDYLDLLKWIKSKGANIYAQYDMVITPSMQHRDGVINLNLSFEEKKRLLKAIREVEGGKEIKVEEMEHTERGRIRKNQVPCYAGITGLYISPDGKVSPCVEWDEILGDLRETDLIDIWNKSRRLKEIRLLRIKDYKECSNCRYLGLCSICPGLNLRDRGDIFSPSRLACERARMYYETREEREDKP